ncbi:MAG: polyketide synthase [Proteobacteria bacterium]|nr:MAG: polyketide synthase [Pseudomonadota bacterium]
MSEAERPDNAIAIVGMAGRFPGARDVEQFWRNVRDGVESIRALSDEELLAAGADPAWLRDPSYVKAAGTLDDVAMFDAGYFGFGPKDAAILDPQHRHFMECAVTALEHAGHGPKTFRGAVGVFAGCGMNAYFVHNLLSNPELVRNVGLFLLRHTGNDRDFLASTVSYKLDLRGPSVAVQTACSTSLVAIHTACQSLLSGECDMALAGGVTVLVPHGHGYFYRENEPVAPDGHCRPFDVHSAGTVVASGAGVVVLRRLADALEDGDTIYAVIRGSAVNNDGAGKVGYLAPSVGGHAAVAAEALAIAGVDADSIQYVEAHGTGTAVGDPIEIAALTQAFRETTERRQFCRIGSVKSNIGHLDTAAGVASLIKVVQAMRHREMPPTIHFTAPNPEIDFESSPFVVNAELRPWEAGATPRRAGVSSLGIGGTNAHVVLEEAPEQPPSDPPQRATQLFVLSAKTPAALDAATDQLADYFDAHADAPLADVAFTLQEGREAHDHRRVVAASSAAAAAAALRSRDAQRVFGARRESGAAPVAFLFAGAGAQHPNMGRDLYEHEPVFRREMDACFAQLASLLDFDLKRCMYPAPGDEDAARRELELPSRLCPAVFATEWALAKLWSSWGVEPTAMIGHSLGEYAAACVAGVMSLGDALRLVVLRGTLIDRLSGGAMMSVPLPEDEVRALLGDSLDLAAVNGPSLCAVSGTLADVEALAQRLAAERELECRVLPVNAAGHSRHLDSILEEFGRGVAAIRLSPPKIPYLSNPTGTWVRPEDATDPAYWVRHLRHTVRFSDGVAELLREPDRVLLEVGPGQTLCSLARQQPARPRAIVPSMRKQSEPVSDVEFAVTAFGRAWAAGVPVSFAKLRGAGRRRRIALPTYPFEHKQPYWIEPGKRASAAEERETPLERLASMDDWFQRAGWRRAPLAGAAPAGPEKWLVFQDGAGLASKVVDRLRAAGHSVVTVRPGDTFYCFGDHEYALAPEAGRTGYDQLAAALAARELLPDRVAHFWAVTADETFRPGSSFLHRNQECGFYSLLFLMQALADRAETLPRHVAVFSNGMQSVAGEPLPHPDKATLLGAVRVIPHEFAGVRCQSVDVSLPVRETARWLRRRGHEPIAPIADAVLAELAAAPDAQVVALRGADRFEETFEPATPPALGAGASRIRDGGTYLVTGGLGGIGFALAERLALRHRAKLVLIGRTGLPPEESWDGWLATHGERDATSRRIRSVRALRAQGGDAWVAAADVADVERMREVIAAAKERFGALHGVLHAAGAFEDGLIQTKTPESVERVFTTKLHGTLVLARLLADEPLDFFAVFSSTSARLGPPGQVDYVAANCFLNAFAAQRAQAGAPFTAALEWGVWHEVGGATALSKRLRGEAAEDATSRLPGHPLLGECVADGPETWRYLAAYRPSELWVLAEHRGPDGAAIVPGTAYLELARAAFRDVAGPRGVELRDVAFLAPLVVADDQSRRIEIELVRRGESYAFEVRSADDATVFARGVAAALVETATAPLDLPALRARCARDVAEAKRGEALRSSQEAQLGFGPRWSTLRRVGFGAEEGVAELALAPELAGDCGAWELHPALLDIATGFALPAIPGFEPGRALYVPLGYARVRVHAPLVANVVSHVRSRPGNQFAREVATFDVVIADPSGEVLVEVDGYAMRKLDPKTAFARPRAAVRATRPEAHGTPLSPAERVFLETFEAGLRADEGFDALARVLSAESGGATIVSTIPLAPWRERLERACAAEMETPSVKFDRPELASEYEAPRDDLEKTLAGFFEELLGVDRIGIHDDFFELGGHSLIAVRLFAKIKKQWGVEYPISVLFDAPTVAKCAELLRPEVGATSASAAPAAARGPKYRFLVPMNRIEATDKLPFFLVAGMFGNVLNLRHLAAHLGKDQPVYALQAKGLYGDDEPHRRFPDAAEDYLREVRSVQPEGPYLLGGFSGGGVTAFEMAQQLLAQGEEVAGLILLDSIPPPPAWPSLTRRDRMIVQWQRVRRGGLGYLGQWVRNRVKWELEKRERRREGERPELTPAEFRSEQIEAAFREALAHYAMKPYPGKVQLFRPPLDACHDLGGGRLANRRRERIEHHNFWQPWVAAIDVHVVPGDHDSMVLEPSVRVLASRVRGALEDAQRRKPHEPAA